MQQEKAPPRASGVSVSGVRPAVNRLNLSSRKRPPVTSSGQNCAEPQRSSPAKLAKLAAVVAVVAVGVAAYAGGLSTAPSPLPLITSTAGGLGGHVVESLVVIDISNDYIT
ncbi:hypothetical protein TSOC_007897 [Tetrabaena socialis]|uniref:Uncharacterized protein n=1 Tax=Tetrabaena socialis TaxID=47790 RepID=A0A2J7ZZU2_9CHLO|nr:hypothetical protein TSOC_007897 [Tetrabaena socialis]|eukprot:PNH05791.1 hypothetical protein TSOC_007897 [Tetrabaena socialis]